MAIFHHSTQVIGRSNGRSSVGAAAYRLGVAMVDERTGQSFDFTRKAGVDSWHTLAPDNAPEWVNDPARLWNEVERAEKRKDAQLCREVNIALPKELTPEQMKDLALAYAREQWVARGMVAQVAFHDLESHNPHCHVMLTMREIGPDGFGKKNRDWNERSLATVYREAWATRANEALARHGHEARIDHRTLEAQGIDRAPTQHLGPAAAAMKRKGIAIERAMVMPAPPSMDQESARRELERERANKQRLGELVEAQARVAAAKEAHDTATRKASGSQRWAKAWAAKQHAEKAGAAALMESARVYKADAKRERGRVDKWEQAHPLRAWLGWKPSEIRQAEELAVEWESKAKTKADEARARLDHCGRMENRKWALVRVAEGRKRRLDTTRQELEQAQLDARRLAERHAWESLTPEQQAQKRQAELDRAAAVRQERKQAAEAEKAAREAYERRREQEARLEAIRRAHEAQKRDRGRDWGMSL